MLLALSHIIGANLALFCFTALLHSLAKWESDWNQKRFNQELAVLVGVSVDSLDDEEMKERRFQVISERSSNELLKNRLSDFCGIIREAWILLARILQVVFICWAILAAIFGSPEDAGIAWAAVVIAIVFCLIDVCFAFLCFVVTGRLPGEAKLLREYSANYHNSLQSNSGKIS